MTSFARRHHFSQRTKLTAGATGLALKIGLAVAISGSGDGGTAQADAADESLFIDITRARPKLLLPTRCLGETPRLIKPQRTQQQPRQP